MKDGMLVFDASVHCQDFSDNQIKRGSDGRRVQILRDHQERFINITGRRGPPPETETFSNPDLDWGNEMLFGKSDTDLASACSVPLFAHWKAGLGPVEMSHALA
ncbi:MAG: amidohydrolase, partial [bacterium]|nr:amidohydrolase [bacterium]